MTGDKKPFYITTTLPYVNAEPHLGHALEFVRADTIARYKKLQGFDVFFNTGTDEHGQKVYRKATEEGKNIQAYVDSYAAKFKAALTELGISEDVHFIRTTDAHHVAAAQEFWKVCDTNGYIYKKNYQVKYCVGCELEKSESELENGRCKDHPNLELELIDEENYFFKWSAFQDKLLKFYAEHPHFVIPDTRFNEIKAFVSRGLQDFSISRLAEKMPWGVPVPGDEKQVMYVWFDALVNYISTIGWPSDSKSFEKWQVESGGMVQYCGKDNLRQQSAMWQAMLMAARLPNSQTIVIDGFITGAGGVKMSKSLGNVADPLALVAEYGTDALRYYLLREVSSFEDSPFTMEAFKEAYNAGLANGIGNLTSRILTLSEKYIDTKVAAAIVEDECKKEMNAFVAGALDSFNLQHAAELVWTLVGKLDKRISDEQVFKVVKTDAAAGKKLLEEYIACLAEIAYNLKPFLAETAEKMLVLIKENKKPETPLFARKD